MAKERDIRIYRLRIVFDKANKELIHLSESIDNDGDVTFNVGDKDVTVPKEMAKILNRLEDTTLGIT